MSIVPDDLLYTSDHEWVRVLQDAAGGSGAATVRVGITDHAQDALGDVVYVSLPALGAAAEAGEALGEIESHKSVSELFAPLSGTVVARNDALEGAPELLNSDPYGDGWIVEIEIADRAAIDALLAPAAYAALVEG